MIKENKEGEVKKAIETKMVTDKSDSEDEKKDRHRHKKSRHSRSRSGDKDRK